MNTLLLDNKYQLAWAEYGSPDGEPVIYFHGIPGSRLEAKPADRIARDLGIRLIAPERPGCGDSDQQDNFEPLDWPDIIVRLADTLNIHRFSILSFSGGGIFALACAHEIADRIKHITLISSSAPYQTDAMQNSISSDFKPLYELAVTDHDATVQQVSLLASSAEAMLTAYESALHPEDIAIINNEKMRAQFLDNITLTINKGPQGLASDLRCFASPWKFNLQDIKINIDIWHGRSDQNIGFSVAEYLAKSIKNNSTHFLDNKGHLYLFTQWQEILESIISPRKNHVETN